MLYRNLEVFIKNNKLLFALLITTQIAAVVIILFSFGIYRNNQYKLAEGKESENALYVDFNPEQNDGVVVEVSRLKEKLPDIAERYNVVENVVVFSRGHLDKSENIEVIAKATGRDDYKANIRSDFRIIGNELTYGKAQENILLEIEGRNFTLDEFKDGKKVCFVSSGMYKIHNDYWMIDGASYEVVAYENEVFSDMTWDFLPLVIPFNSLEDTMELDEVFIMLKRPLLRSEYEVIKAEFDSLFSPEEAALSDFYPIEIDEKATMKTMMFVAVFMSLISAFSVCLIYRYMLTKRVKATAVYRICGCTAVRSALIYISEMMVVLFSSCLIGSLFFELLVEPRLEKSYTWFAVIYENNSCYLLIVMYFVIVSLTAASMIALKCRETPKEMLYNRIK